MAEKQIRNATVLAILPAREDRLSLSVALADSGWILVFAGNVREALAVQQSIVVGAVLCDIRFPGGHTWKDLINQMLRLEDPPPLILADRLADDCLWAEALNLGAYDVLAMPFDSREALRTVATACRRHEKRSGLARKRRQVESSRESKEAARAMSAAL